MRIVEQIASTALLAGVFGSNLEAKESKEPPVATMMNVSSLFSKCVAKESKEPPVATMLNVSSLFNKCEPKKAPEPAKCCEPEVICCDPKSRGSFSFGYTVGYGRIQVTEDDIISSSFLEPLLQNIFNTNKRSGGFSTRAFANALADISDQFAIGVEAGFSWYPTSKYSQNFTFSLAALGLDASFGIRNAVVSKGYGADLLINMTIYPIPECFFTIKPGIQFARQKNTITSSIDLGIGALGVPGLGLPTGGKYRNTSFLPQIIIGGGWNIPLGRCANKNMRKYAIVIEMDYQHVFGQDDAPINKRVNSRDMIGASVGLRF